MSIFTPEELRANNALTEDQLSQKIAVDKRTLQAWRLRGGGPKFVKMGRSVRYFPQLVNDWAASSTFSSTSESEEAK